MRRTIDQAMESKMSAMNSKLITLNQSVSNMENSIESHRKCFSKRAKFQKMPIG